MTAAGTSPPPSSSQESGRQTDVPSGEFRLCTLSASLAAPPEDPLRAWARHFEVEKNWGGVVIRLKRPGRELPTIETEFQKVGLRSYAFEPCEEHIVLWVPGNLCEAGAPRGEVGDLVAPLGDHEIIECFSAEMIRPLEDCHAGRLPQERCERRVLEGLEACRALEGERKRMLLDMARRFGVASADELAACGD